MCHSSFSPYYGRLFEVQISTGEVATIEGPFGASGKTKLMLKETIGQATREKIQTPGEERVQARLYMKKRISNGSLTSYIPVNKEESGEVIR